MGRIHLFELCDQPWLPRPLRHYMTEYLCFVEERAGTAMQSYVPLIEQLLSPGEERIVDLCSGPAGPWRALLPALASHGRRVKVTLTDISPTPEYIESLPATEALEYVREPVDAAHLPESLRGPRVIFNGLHHFQPERARAILEDAAHRGEPIGVFEMLSRHPAHTLAAPLVFTFALLAAPFVRPFRWGRLFWSWLVPIAPLAIMWDGWVSSLRVYSQDELRALVENINAPGYSWEVGEVRTMGPPAPYLIGRPSSGTTNSEQ